ncbi:MATE family efflux transporter, partial [Klebsiella pneumoniae]|uniref:MATE family efflux transporter n=1 Tax=Klebsiella pneumoniae TaxID=573 RepID=UPI0019531E36
LLAIALGMISALLLFAFAEPMLRGIGVAAEITPLAAAVVRVMALAYPFQLLIVTASFFLEGVSRPQRVTVVNL